MRRLLLGLVVVGAMVGGTVAPAAAAAKWRGIDVSEFPISANAINVDFNVWNTGDVTAQPVCVIDVYVSKKFVGAASLLNLSLVKPRGADISINNRVPIRRAQAHRVTKHGVQISCASG